MGIFGKSETKPAESVPKPAAQAPATPLAAAPTMAPVAPGGAAAACVIGPRATLKGEVLGDDDIAVHGSIEGMVRISRELRVAPGGRVSASVHAASIVVSGVLVGNCVASQRIEIQATGRLTGDIRAPRITIIEGASFKGKCEMGRAAEKTHRAVPPAPD